MNIQNSPFWSLSTAQVLQQTHSTIAGLSRQDVKQRQSESDANSVKQTHQEDRIDTIAQSV